MIRIDRGVYKKQSCSQMGTRTYDQIQRKREAKWMGDLLERKRRKT